MWKSIQPSLLSIKKYFFNVDFFLFFLFTIWKNPFNIWIAGFAFGQFVQKNKFSIVRALWMICHLPLQGLYAKSAYIEYEVSSPNPNTSAE